MTLRIISAALKRGDLIFSAPPPARHGTLMREADRLFGDRHQPFLPGEQGFIGNNGLFYDRDTAGTIALAAGQTDALEWGTDLYSEDLW